jgi:glycosyltransferase involved in cell wall biosynthesis
MNQDHIWHKNKISEQDKELYYEYQAAKMTPEYLSVFEKKEPLVSVIITTYNAGEMLLRHSLKSVLQQTYKNLQIIVIGDGCTDNTEELMSQVFDERVWFINKKHEVPPNDTWCWVGAIPINFGLNLCKGDYICHLDDDDFFLPDRIEKLVEFNKAVKADILHHPFRIFYLNDRVLTIESEYYGPGQITTSSMFYHGWFRRMEMEMNPDAIEQGDWNKSRRMVEFGGKTARYPEILMLMSQIRHCINGRNQVPPLPQTLDYKWSERNNI